MNRSPAAAPEVAAVTFDAAGTLLRPHPSVGAVYRTFALAHGCDYPEAGLNRAFRAALRTAAKDPAIADPEARERAFWKAVVRATILGVPAVPPATFDDFFAEVWEAFAHAVHWQVYPDVHDTLAALRRRGYRLGVVSNWDRRLHRVLEETGLRPCFDAVVISSEAGADKPDRAIFRAAERALQTPPAHCLHLGDSREHDIDGARAAGWQAWRIRHDEGAAAPDEIRGFAPLLERLPARRE